MLKVIGASFPRTGTLSLKHALEELGFAQCYHMIEVLKNPEHIPVWLAASQGKTVDWERLFDGYQATTDSPSCHYYLELMERYPEAQVILTVRDPEGWYKSAYNTIYKILPEMKKIRPDQGEFAEQFVWQNIFKSRFSDKDFAIKVFNEHVEQVKSLVPSHRLLIYHIKEGWEPLCQFLKTPVPNTPFPHLNDMASFPETVKKLGMGVLPFSE